MGAAPDNPLRDIALHSTLMTCLGPEEDALRTRIRDITRLWHRELPTWERDGHLPRRIFKEIGAAGVLRERWAAGRQGLGRAVVIAEELALVGSGPGLAGTIHCEVFTGSLVRHAQTDAQRSLLEAALDGDVVGCFAVTEPRGGSDIASVTTNAEQTPGGWRLRGTKRYISNAGTATHALVLARTAPGGTGGPSTFVVPLDSPGVEVDGFFPKMGTESCDAAQLNLDVELHGDALLGRRGFGMVSVMRVLQLERVAVSAQLLVAATVALRLAAAHARQRRQFDQRLLDHQALRHRLADAAAELWSAEALLNSVMIAAQRSQSVHDLTAALKLRCAATAARVVDDSLQVLGGRGYTQNYPVERMYRDIRLARIGAGTDEIMRELVAMRLGSKDGAFDDWAQQLDDDDLPVPDPGWGSTK